MNGANMSKILILGFRIASKLKITITARLIMIDTPFASYFGMIGDHLVDFRALEKMLTAPK